LLLNHVRGYDQERGDRREHGSLFPTPHRQAAVLRWDRCL
jgi:hypothetical protein